jgi:hypothetical protein
MGAHAAPWDASGPLPGAAMEPHGSTRAPLVPVPWAGKVGPRIATGLTSDLGRGEERRRIGLEIGNGNAPWGYACAPTRTLALARSLTHVMRALRSASRSRRASDTRSDALSASLRAFCGVRAT